MLIVHFPGRPSTSGGSQTGSISAWFKVDWWYQAVQQENGTTGRFEWQSATAYLRVWKWLDVHSPPLIHQSARTLNPRIALYCVGPPLVPPARTCQGIMNSTRSLKHGSMMSCSTAFSDKLTSTWFELQIFCLKEITDAIPNFAFHYCGPAAASSPFVHTDSPQFTGTLS